MTSPAAVLTFCALQLANVDAGGVHLGTVASSSVVQAHAVAPPDEDPLVPEGTITGDPATKGTTDVASGDTFAEASDVDARHAEDATELEIAAGGLLSSGNAFAAAATTTGRFRLRRGRHQVASQVAGNYGRADVAQLDDNGITIGTSRETTVSNVQGMIRYDVFFAEHWSAFLMATARRDRFQGLDLRLNIDPGVAYHVLTDPHHRLWFELGYDFQYDVRRDEAIVDDTGASVADKTQLNHAIRTFAGYNNSLSERFTFDTGLEYLQSVIVGRRFRINWINALTVQLANRLGLGVTFTLRYENEPLPEVAKLDTITAVLLTVRFL